MKTSAFAKINLYLDVLARRADGFHDIKSVMQSVSLCDVISCERSTRVGKISLECSDSSLSCGEDNLAYRAAKLFFEHYGIDAGVELYIEKNIPISAGLAGGSTDAAATLVILNEMFGCDASTHELCMLGARLGSDVPFCIVGGTCAALGRGEELDVLFSELVLELVIAKAGEGISTPAAYGMLDERFGADLAEDFGSLEAVASAMCLEDELALSRSLHNTFESVILERHEPARLAKEYMLSSDGCRAALLSGSGPAVFGIYADRSSACRAADELTRRGYTALACTSVSAKARELTQI